MQTQIGLTLFFLLVLGTIKSGECLRCWTCLSDMNGDCGDFFNSTLLTRRNYGMQYPTVELVNCEPQRTMGDHSYACLKKVMSVGSRKEVRRQCEQLSNDRKETTCPKNSANNYEFCEYCYTDGCNGATALKTTTALLSVFLPFVFYFSK